MQEEKKYKITQQEGADLFLNALKPIVQNETVKDVDKEFKKKFKRNSYLVIAIIIAFTAGLSVLGYFAVTHFRQKSIALREISEAVADYETQSPAGLDVEDQYKQLISVADSLLSVLDKMILDNPKEDTLKTMWASIFLHKYEKGLHYALKNNLFSIVEKIDDGTLRKIKKYNSEYFNLIPIMYNLPDFYKFAEEYNAPPRLSEIAPKQTQIEDLIDKIKEIEYISRKNAVALDVHFPILNNWITYFFNSVAPELYEWEKFWNNYKTAITNADDKINYARIMQELAYEYPNLQLLKENNFLQNIQSFRFGIVGNVISPINRNPVDEINPFLSFLKRTYNINLQLYIFDDYFELYQAFKDGEVDIAMMDFPTSATCYFSGLGLPIAQRSWSGRQYVNYAVYGVNRKISDDKDLYNRLTASTYNDNYLFIKLISSGSESRKLLNNRIYAPQLDTLLNAINKGACSTVLLSDEEYLYLSKSGKLKSSLIKYKDIVSVPLDVLWIGDSINPNSIKRLIDVIIPALPSDIYKDKAELNSLHPYSNWDAYENEVMIKYYTGARELLVKLDEQYNKLHLFPIISESDSVSRRLQKEFSEYLENIGFKVSHVNEELRDTDAIYVKVKKEKDKLVFETYKNTGSGKNVLYKEKIKRDDVRKSLEHKLFDLTSHINVKGKITKIEGRRIEITTNLDIHSTNSKIIYLFKPNNDSDNLTKKYAQLKINSIKSHKIIAYASKEDLKNIKYGDTGVVINAGN